MATKTGELSLLLDFATKYREWIQFPDLETRDAYDRRLIAYDDLLKGEKDGPGWNLYMAQFPSNHYIDFAEEERLAKLVSDLSASFPERFGLPRCYDASLISRLIVWIDGGGELEGVDLSLVSRIFYKHFALPGMTWADLANEWIGEHVRAHNPLSDLVQKLPGTRLLQFQWKPAEGLSEETFSLFIQRKTREAFEKCLGGSLAPIWREALGEAILDPKVRDDLVFYLCHPTALIQDGVIHARTETGKRWCTALRRMKKVHTHYSLPVQFTHELFSLAFHAGPNCQELIDWDNFQELKRIPIARRKCLRDVETAFPRFKEFLPEDLFKKVGFSLFLIILKWDGARLSFFNTPDFVRFWEYCAFSHRSILSFVRTRAILTGYAERRRPMHQFLNRVNAVGTTPLLLSLSLDELPLPIEGTTRGIDEMQVQGLSAHTALRIVQSLRGKEEFEEQIALCTRLRQRYRDLQPDQMAGIFLAHLTLPIEDLVLRGKVIGELERFSGAALSGHLVAGIYTSERDFAPILKAIEELFILRHRFLEEHVEKEEIPRSFQDEVALRIASLVSAPTAGCCLEGSAKEMGCPVGSALAMLLQDSFFLYNDKVFAGIGKKEGIKEALPFSPSMGHKRLYHSMWNLDGKFPTFVFTIENTEFDETYRFEVALKVPKRLCTPEFFTLLHKNVLLFFDQGNMELPKEYQEVFQPIAAFIHCVVVEMRKTTVKAAMRK